MLECGNTRYCRGGARYAVFIIVWWEGLRWVCNFSFEFSRSILPPELRGGAKKFSWRYVEIRRANAKFCSRGVVCIWESR